MPKQANKLLRNISSSTCFKIEQRIDDLILEETKFGDNAQNVQLPKNAVKNVNIDIDCHGYRLFSASAILRTVSQNRQAIVQNVTGCMVLRT